MLAGELAEQERRDLGRVAERLVVHGRQQRYHLERISRTDHQLIVVSTQMLSNRTGVGRLVIRLFGKADREGSHWLARATGHNRHDRGRVDTTGKKRSQRDIRDHPSGDGDPQQVCEFVDRILAPRAVHRCAQCNINW